MSHNKQYTYVTNDVNYQRKDKPEAWCLVGEAPKGKMFMSYPVFSFIPGTHGDEEPIRSGDFVIDIDTGDLACKSALQIVSWFEITFGVETESWRVYLSGKKGIHLELPAGVMGTEDGHIWLPLAYKRLAKEIEGTLGITLDTSMYNKGTGKPYRQPNVMRETGTCKRQVEIEDLHVITDEEEYREFCDEPGETWEPEDIEPNPILVEKLQVFLEEATKAQDELKDVVPLTSDELDLLKYNMPACMAVMANTINWQTYATFNDIAMQLTAYAVTTGISEADLLAGCRPFIEHYPSSSLTTLEKRYQNIRDRYRTMSANGNQHSCGAVLALRIPGFDCALCPAKEMAATPAPHIEIMEAADLATDNSSLQIPEKVLDPGGLISQGIKALSAPGLVDIPQYNLAAILSTLAHAAAGKMTCMGVWPNVFNIKVGPTSSGKTTSDQALFNAINEMSIPNFHGMTDFASGPALMRSVAQQPIQMIVIDECTHLFKRYKGGDATSDGKRDALLELFSKSGSVINRSYADSKNNIIIEQPCVTLTGNATPVIFDAIEQDDFETGTMQRFDFWSYEGDLPKRGLLLGENDDLKSFAEGIREIRNLIPGSTMNGVDMAGLTGGGHPIKMILTDSASSVLQDYSADIMDRANAATSEGERGIISRAYHLAIKYAMIHVVGTRPTHAIYFPIDVQNIEYGIAVARMLSDWKITVLQAKVTTGEFDKMCNIFLSAIKAVQRTGKRPTYKTMANRRPVMKNWRKRDSAEVIEILEKRKEIVVDESKSTTAYFLPKTNTEES